MRKYKRGRNERDARNGREKGKEKGKRTNEGRKWGDKGKGVVRGARAQTAQRGCHVLKALSTRATIFSSVLGLKSKTGGGKPRGKRKRKRKRERKKEWNRLGGGYGEERKDLERERERERSDRI